MQISDRCMEIGELFGDNIRRRRNEIGISQEKLADLCELHRTYIGGIERGERNPSLKNIIAISRALQISPAELMKGIK